MSLISRRSFLALSAGAATAPLLGGLSFSAETDVAIIGAGDDGVVSFWSFTSDGKRSQGQVADVSEIHPEAIGFEAQMPAGLARMAYWPDEDGKGFYWAVEAKVKRGWKRFTSHHYRPA